jgi:hypothetical protein
VTELTPPGGVVAMRRTCIVGGRTWSDGGYAVPGRSRCRNHARRPSPFR